ncbi:MAG: DNA-binding protein [Sulfurifustis sp.]
MSAIVSTVDADGTTDTRTLVKRAADDLLTQGERPTVANVRARIGRGSATTINSALAEWWQNLAERLAAARARPDVPVPVMEAADLLWNAALEQADVALKLHREAADKKVDEANAAANAALLARDEANQESQKLRQAHQELERARLDLERRLAVETEQRRAAEAKIAEVRADGDRRIGELGERIRHLEQLLERERARFDSMEKRLSEQLHEEKTNRVEAVNRHQADSAAWRAEKNELLKQIQQVRTAAIEAQTRIIALDGQLGEMRQTCAALQAAKEALLIERADLQAKASQAEKIEESVRGEVSALRETIKNIEAARTLLQQQLTEARNALLEVQAHASAESA